MDSSMEHQVPSDQQQQMPDGRITVEPQQRIPLGQVPLELQQQQYVHPILLRPPPSHQPSVDRHPTWLQHQRGYVEEMTRQLHELFLHQLAEIQKQQLEFLQLQQNHLLRGIMAVFNASMMDQAAAVKALELKPQPARNQSKADQNHERAKPSGGRSGPDTACWLCGAMHHARDCTFKMHKCNDCGQTSHEESFCRSAETVNFVRKKNNTVSAKVVTVSTCSVKDRRKFVPVVMNRTCVRLQLDTGSKTTIISTETWRSIGSPPLSTTSIVAKTATGKPLEIDGEFWCEMVVGGQKSSGLVRDTRRPLNLLGSDTIDSFGLWLAPLDSICHLVENNNKNKLRFAQGGFF